MIVRPYGYIAMTRRRACAVPMMDEQAIRNRSDSDFADNAGQNGWICAALSRRWVMSISRVCGSYIGADRATTRIAIAAATVLANASLCMGTASAQSAGKKGPPKPATTQVTSEDLLRNIACLEQRLRMLEE